MSSAEDVQNTNGILTLPRFQKCMGRVPSDEKIPGDMSDEGKCTVRMLESRIRSLKKQEAEINRTNMQQTFVYTVCLHTIELIIDRSTDYNFYEVGIPTSTCTAVHVL